MDWKLMTEIEGNPNGSWPMLGVIHWECPCGDGGHLSDVDFDIFSWNEVEEKWECDHKEFDPANVWLAQITRPPFRYKEA